MFKHIVTNESFATVHTTRTAYTEGETSAVCKDRGVLCGPVFRVERWHKLYDNIYKTYSHDN